MCRLAPHDGLDPAVLQAIVPSAAVRFHCLEFRRMGSAYHGPTVAVLASLTLIAIWSWLRVRLDDNGANPTWRQRMQTAIGSVCRGAAFGAAPALVAVLALIPSFLHHIEANYQLQLAAQLNGLPERRAELVAKIQAIESDTAKMQEFRTSAQEFLHPSCPVTSGRRAVSGLAAPARNPHRCVEIGRAAAPLTVGGLSLNLLSSPRTPA